MSVEVVEKTFRVLESLAGVGGSLSLAELTQRVRLPKPTVYRLLRSLLELGYVAQDPGTGRYLSTPRLAHLGRAGERDEIKRLALPAMRRLHERFDETVNLGVLDRDHVAYVHFIETSQPLRLLVRPEARDPFHCTALGRAIVAQLPEAERERLVSEVELGAGGPRSKAALRRILAETRARIWAIDDEELVAGVACFGVPLMAGCRPIAAISITLPKDRLDAARQREIIADLLSIHDAFRRGT
jgi:DNA-binding IclR family transcriptional regulator